MRNCFYISILDKKKDTYNMKNILSFSEFSTDNSNTISEKKGPCWKGYKQVGTKIKNGKMVPNCVPEKSIK